MITEKTMKAIYIFCIVALTALTLSYPLIGAEDEGPHVIYDCYYAEKLIYDYNVSGMMLWDMDTGRFYNINYCLGINAPQVIWEGTK